MKTWCYCRYPRQQDGEMVQPVYQITLPLTCSFTHYLALGQKIICKNISFILTEPWAPRESRLTTVYVYQSN